MMNWISRVFIGGNSGTKEIALLVLILYVAGAGGVFGTSTALTWRGIPHDFSLAVEFLKFITGWVFGFVGVAFGIGKIGSFGAFGTLRQDENQGWSGE